MAQDNPAGLEGGPESPSGVGSPPRPAIGSRAARIVFWALTGLAVVLLVVSIVMLFVITRVYAVSTPTMGNTVPSGDRVLLASGAGVRRGDVVVLRVPVSVSGTSTVFVKRVIGLPGDHVACCDSRGRVIVNGRPLDESYLHPGDPPSRSGFSVSLGPGQIWVMGDSRTISVDSRKWGPVPISGVVGRVVLVNHGVSFTALHTPRTYVTEGLAPADTRSDAYLVLGLLIACSIVALLVLALAGVASLMIGHRRATRAPATVPAPAPAAATSSSSSSSAAAASSSVAAPPVPSAAVPVAAPATPAPAAPSPVPAAAASSSAPPGGAGAVGDPPAPPGPPEEGLAEA
jgi:signal peptidase I